MDRGEGPERFRRPSSRGRAAAGFCGRADGAKEDFAADFTYREFARKRLEKFQAALEEIGNKKGPTDVTVGGRPAVQYEFSALATDERVRMYYLHISIDGKGAFHQMMAWSNFSARAASRPTLEEAIRGFTDLS